MINQMKSLRQCLVCAKYKIVVTFVVLLLANVQGLSWASHSRIRE